MQDIKLDQKNSVWKRLLAIQLAVALACSGVAPAYAASPTGDVSVEANSAAIQNIGRAMQSPDARPANPFILPIKPLLGNIAKPVCGSNIMFAPARP